MYKLVIVLALAVAASAVPRTAINKLSPTGRIVGGEATSIDEVPYQVSLRALSSHICGASIISEEWILTAAHCMVYPSSWYSIRVGSTLSNSGGSTHDVAEAISHESYSSNRYGIPINDIALLRVSTKITLDSVRQPIELFNSGEEFTVGDLAVITGWGTLTSGGSSPTVLQTVSVPMVATSECSNSYSVWGGLPDGQICAAYPEGGKDACQGDSGGPLAIDGRLAGVVSWGNGCALAGWPGVYTSVAYYRDWVLTNSGV